METQNRSVAWSSHSHDSFVMGTGSEWLLVQFSLLLSNRLGRGYHSPKNQQQKKQTSPYIPIPVDILLTEEKQRAVKYPPIATTRWLTTSSFPQPTTWLPRVSMAMEAATGVRQNNGGPKETWGKHWGMSQRDDMKDYTAAQQAGNYETIPGHHEKFNEGGQNIREGQRMRCSFNCTQVTVRH